jgi:uncharacterized repeat protein (TIGR01451 family)
MGTGSRSGHRLGRGRRIARRLVCEVLERRELLSLVVTSTSDDSSPNTLRWAIQQADAGSSSSTVEIDFNIQGPGSLAIHLASPLPSITVPVLIDGTTEPGYHGIPLVEVDGSGLSGGGNEGLVLTAAGNTVRGLSLVGFSDSAIVLASGGDSAIAGNYIGLTPSGSRGLPNHEGITLLGSSGNTIGAGTAGIGNVISGNSGDGLLIEPGVGADSADNLVVGNWIGTSPDGLHAIPNGAAGIAVAGASANLIGAPGQVFANVVAGNAGPGILLTNGAQGTSIRNNLIGLAADGKTPLGNQGDGIQLDATPATQVGGTNFDEGNIISANQGNGISTSGNTAGLQVVGNEIGTDATTALQLGNLQNGISLASSSNTIGGTGAGAANVIEFNGTGRVGAGVQLVGTVDHNSILSNSIYANAGLGINFGSGPTPNHAPGTPGPNDYVNYPVLSIATNDGTATSIQGTLFESPNTSYLLQFFSSPQPDPSGYGQGRALIGSMTVGTDAQGEATFTTGLPPTAGPGAFVSATVTDPAGNTSEFSGDVSVQGRINLAITGAASPNPVPAGANLTYTLTVTNQGTIGAQSVILSDQLPAGVTIVSVTPSQGGLMNMLGGNVTVALGTIAAGGSTSVGIVVRTGPGSIGKITDTATATSGQDQASTSILATVETSADLSISLAANAPTVLAGGYLTYTMTVTNNGPGPASKVVASLPLGPTLAFVSASATIGSASLVGGQVNINMGDLATGTQSIVTVLVQTTAAGSLTETAAVSGDSLDPDPSNNSSSVTTEVDPASDLAVKIEADTDVVANGVPFNYTVKVTNNGPSDATSVVLNDTLPAGVALVTASTDSGLSPSVTDGVVSVTFATLAAGSSAQMLMAVNPAASPGSKLIDTATVGGDQADPNPANNAASLILPVRGVSDLAVTATIQPGPYYVGQPLTYTVDVTNNGPADEPDAVVASALPDGLLVDSTRSSQGADPPVNNGILTADLGPLGAGQTAVVTLVVTPGPGNAGTLTTVFNAQGLDYDSDPSNNTAPVSVTVAPSCDLSVVISPGNTAAVAQLGWSYTVQVKNSGPSLATGVVARIPVPPAVQFDSASPSQGIATIGQDGVLTADLGAIAAGGSATITLNVEPTQSVGGGSIPLAASVSGDEYDPDPANNQTSLNLAVTPSVKVALVLQSTPQVIQSGQVITFTASVSNLGSTPATNVIVTFPQVNGLAFLSSTPSQGTPALVSGQFFARMGDIEPGGSAMVTVQEQATVPGNFTQAASVSEDEYNLDYSSASATASAQVVESPGMLQFSAGNYQVTDQAGVAVIPVIRLYGASGTITVHYQTNAINATPGLDFTPTEGTLTLGPGQGSGSIQVPVLDDPYNNHDEYVSITLDGPTGGAVLGPTTSAVLHIQDVDPNFTPPRVSSFTWAGSPAAITSLTLYFTAPLDPTYATDADDYHLVKLVGGSIPIASIHYDAAQFAVTIVPQAPIPSGQYAKLQLVGLGPAAVRDIAGNVLDGVGDGVPGSDYTVTFAQGTRLKYFDNAGNTVTLKVRGPGYLQQVLDASRSGIVLNLVGMVPHRTTLSGRIKPHNHSSGQTELGTITGLGQFGDVKVLMKAPPFRVNQLPFQRRGRYVL